MLRHRESPEVSSALLCDGLPLAAYHGGMVGEVVSRRIKGIEGGYAKVTIIGCDSFACGEGHIHATGGGCRREGPGFTRRSDRRTRGIPKGGTVVDATRGVALLWRRSSQHEVLAVRSDQYRECHHPPGRLAMAFGRQWN